LTELIKYSKIKVNCPHLMNIYKTIMWFSVVLILGEGLLLSNFDFVPIKAAGQVLGETTEVWWEQIASRPYPASYYSGDVAKTLVSGQQEKQDITSPKDKTTALTENQNKPELSELKKDGSQTDLDQMIEFLNIPSSQDFSLIQPEKSTIDVVSALINKNKRVYLKGVKKELDQIRQDLGTP